MDHNNKQILPGLFSPAFAGLQNAGTSSIISSLGLGPLSGLSTPMLSTGINSADLAQWPIGQSNSTNWIDAKMAAMLPLSQLYFTSGMKGIELSQQATNVNNVNGTQSSNIFQSLVQLPQTSKASPKSCENVESPVNGGPLSNAPSSHPSASTPHEIDVGTSTHFQTQTLDQIPKDTTTQINNDINFALLCKPSTSTTSSSNIFLVESLPSTSAVVTQTQAKATWPDAGEDDFFRRFLEVKDDNGLSSTAKKSQLPTSQHLDEQDSSFDILNLHTEKETTGFLFSQGKGDGNLSPVQFTPPDSPTAPSTSGCDAALNVFETAAAASSRPSPISTPFSLPPTTPPLKKQSAEVFKQPTVPTPKKEPRAVPRLNRVPVYKQKRLAATIADEPLDTKPGDAFAFEDEEDQGLASMESKERLDAEVREKLSKIANNSTDARGKNVYVPGIGFAVPHEPPQQDIWRHVVPKKRPLVENRSIASAYLLPSSARGQAEVTEAAARLAEPEIVTLAESIRRRKKDRFVCPFVKIEPTFTTDCVKEERHPGDGMSTALPRLPKLVIKLSRTSVDGIKERKHKRKKKKKYYESDDSDWEDGSRRKKRHRRSISDRRDSNYELRYVDPDEDENPRVKKKWEMKWQDEVQDNGSQNNEEYSSRHRSEVTSSAIKKRLSKFGPADGHLAKGTFVVCKADLFRNDCALWKIDNQNMLQKFPPKIDALTKHITYKSSKTYSGWCEQIASGYYRIAVKVIKQSRTDPVVEPEIPISDLFPAMTSESADSNGPIKTEEEPPADPNDHVTMLRDPLRLSLYNLTQVVIDHSLTFDHIQAVKAKNDWSFLQAVTEVDRVNGECMAKLKTHFKPRDDFSQALHDFTQLLVVESAMVGFPCQTCVVDKRNAEKAVQLLGRELYDPETLQTEPIPENDPENSPIPAMEFYVCSQCAVYAQQYHRCFHLKYHLMRRCEDKLESLGTQHPDYAPEKIVELVKKSRSWQNQFFSETIELWKKIQSHSISVPVPLSLTS